LPKALDCADSPLTAVFIAPNKDMRIAPTVRLRVPSQEACQRCDTESVVATRRKRCSAAELARHFVPTCFPRCYGMPRVAWQELAHCLLIALAQE
jgi:hypothetical protein